MLAQLVLCLLSIPALAQNRTITGTVTSGEDNSVLPGVSVTLKGTSRGTTTDGNGQYTISVPSGTVTVVYSFIGFTSQEVVTGNQTKLDITLKPDATSLNEVVVTAFGIQRTERELGTSIAKVNSAQINQAAPVNIANGLTGKVSGLQISTTNNGVGAGARITLRGSRSFLGNNQPLLVVDGVVSDISFLNSINPNDVDQTNVLKGPSAAALYGSDASNGVLIITTKKGTKNAKPQISYSNNTQFENISYMPGLQTQFGGNGGEGVPFYDRNYRRLYVPYENQSFGDPYDGSTRPLGYGVEIRDANGNVRLDTLKVPYSSPSKDPRRAFFQTGVTSQHDLSYRIGDAQNFFGLSVQRVDQKGIIPNDKYQRTAIGLNGGRSVDKLAVTGSVKFAYQNTNTENGDFNQNRPVYWNVLNQQAHAPINSYPLNDINSPYGDVNGYYNAYYPNPYWQITGDNSRQVTDLYTIQGSTDVAYQFTPWLRALYRIGGQISTSQYKSHVADVTFSDYALGDPWEAGNIASSVGHANARVRDQTSLFTRFTGDLLITMNPKFGDFTTTLILGQQTRQQFSRSTYDEATALVVPGVYNVANRLGNAALSEYNSSSRLIGFFGDLTLGYKNLAFVHATGRQDYTSLLAPANRTFFYPSVDASLIVSDLIPSLKENRVISYLKLRGGISKVGQVNVAPYQLQNVFNPGANIVTGGVAFPYGSQAGFELGNTQNDPNLKPEFTTNKEVGIELGLFDRFLLEAVYYNTVTTSQTVPIDVSRATGYTRALINTGSMTNSGIELDLRTQKPLVSAGSFTWDASINLTFLKSNVDDIYQVLPRGNLPYASGAGSDVYFAKGYQYPALFVTDIQRIQNTDPKAPNYDATGQFVGRPVVSPTTGYPVLDPNLKYAGTTQPTTRFGWTNTFRYKGLSLNAVVEYRGGAVIYNALGNALEFTGAGIRSVYAGRQNFVFPNSVTVGANNADGTTGTITPNTNITTKDGNLTFWTNSPYHNAGYSYVTSADFWKLREAAIGYDIPANILGYTKFIRTVNIAFTGRNLLMLRPKTNVFTDPEFSGGANANDTSNAVGVTTEYQAPPTRFYGFRVTVGF